MSPMGTDPVDLRNGNTIVRRIDALINNSPEPFALYRMFSNTDQIWSSNAASLAELPKPFGTIAENQATTLWSHSLYSFIAPNNKTGYWLVSGGLAGQHFFHACTPAAGSSCFATTYDGNAADRARLEAFAAGSTSTITSLTFYSADGHSFDYDATFIGSSGAAYYFLSRAYSASRTLLYVVSYSLPDASCPQSADGGTILGPYVDEVTLAAGQPLKFQYEVLPNAAGGIDCVPQELLVEDATTGTWKSIMHYHYTLLDGGTGESGGLLASVIPADAGYNNSGETYTYTSGTPALASFSVAIDGTTTLTHNYDANQRVTGVVQPNPGGGVSYTVTAGSATGTANTCDGSNSGPQYTLAHAAGAGDDFSPSVTLTQTMISPPGVGMEQPVPQTNSISCGGSAACSAGQSESDWTCNASPSLPSSPAWREDRTGNWDTYAFDAGPITYSNQSELVAVQRGASTQNGSDFLDSTQFTYTYDVIGNQHVATESRASVVGGSTTTTYYSYTSDGRLSSAIKKGWTSSASSSGISFPAVSPSYVGTFYFDYQKCSGGTTSDADPLGRILEVHGPCFVDSTLATDCDGGAIPIAQYTYYGVDGGSPTAPPNGAGQLYKVTRYVDQSASSCSGGLTTTYDAYDALGDATQTTDVSNGIITKYTYDNEHHILSSGVNFDAPATSNFQYTTYGYDNDKLTWVKHPSTPESGNADNFEVYCYRDGTTSCTGSWTGYLMWKAKSPNQNGSSPWEKVVYTYWPDGSVKTESYQTSSGEVRRVVTHAQDAEERPVFDRWGEQLINSYTQPRLFDGAGNAIGIGLPFNGAGTLCGGDSSGAPADPKCAALSYDRINRLTSATMPLANAGATKTTTCFAWDAGGNFLAIRQGCTAGACDTCGAAPAQYTYDDFGNVAKVSLPDTANWSGTQGWELYAYDAMGNVIYDQQPLPTFPDGGYGAGIQYSYDSLGRELNASTWCQPGAGCTSEQIRSRVYDAPVSVPLNCPTAASALSYGRVYSQTDTFGTTYFTYDVLGDVTAEWRDRGTGSCDLNPLAGGNSSPNTTYSYDYNGNLTSMHYPRGRPVYFLYDGGNPNRVSTVQVGVYSGGTFVPTTFVDDVVWEPYGGLRGYQIEHTASATKSGVEYVLGDNGSSAPATACPPSFPSNAVGTGDHTGRTRALWVSSGPFTPGQSGSGGMLYDQLYTWSADQLLRSDTCVAGASAARTESYGYDMALRLARADGGLGTSSGGAFGQRVYSLTSTGLRSSETVDGTSYAYTYSATRPDQVTQIQPQPATGWLYKYTYSNDGNVATKTAGMNDSSGGPAMTYTFAEGPSQADAGGADSTVFRAISVGGAWYDYFYDAKMRRRLKQYPSGISDEYFYDVNDELIVDQGNATFDPAGDSYHTEDDYVWLGGRPVLIFRGKLFPGGDRYDDSSTACSRLGETTSAQSVACGAYFPITDYLGKPVAMYDSSQRLTGVGEYQPFGQVNRVSLDKETAHPYSGSQTDFADFVPARVGGLSIDVRTKFQMLDIAAGLRDSRCPTSTPDDVNIVDEGTLATLQSLTGLHAGTVWSNWLTPSVLGARADLVHNSPTTYGCRLVNRVFTCGCWMGSGQGAVVEGYEYRRYQSGATPFWTPLRFPGQYHDEETDLNQNWNRFYEPASGGYLELEPLVTNNPGYYYIAARAAAEVSPYGYALNNPVAFTDWTGLQVCPPNSSCEGCTVVFDSNGMCLKCDDPAKDTCSPKDPPKPPDPTPQPEPQPNQPPADDCPPKKTPNFDDCYKKAAAAFTEIFALTGDEKRAQKAFAKVFARCMGFGSPPLDPQ